MSEWKKERIDYAVATYAGGTPNRSRDDYFNGEIPWISSGEVNQSYINKTKEYITLLGLENSSAKWIPKGAVLLAMYGATAGQVAKLKIRATANQAVLALLPNEEILDKDFLYHLLNIEKDKILFFAQGSGQPNLSKGLIDRYFISFPESTNTQIGIAKILDTCDTVIEQTQSAIAKYKAIKQGLLHDLFTRGMDASGHLRPSYPDAPDLYKESELGMIPKEWEVKRLEECTIMKSGDGITSQYISDSGDFPVFGGNGLRGFTTTFTHEGDYVLIGRQGALCGNITRVSNKFFASEHAVVVTVNKDIDVDWLSQKLDAMNLNQYSEASAQPGLAVAKILRLFITKPQHDEQKEIGKRLLALDNKMNAEEAILQKYQSIKRGLMGDLLGGKKEVKIEELKN